VHRVGCVEPYISTERRLVRHTVRRDLILSER